ncbi:cytochrome P450 [[Mycobacterium] nativiensis]|uniref:Cytochrome P450 n=1 Tax=[Mycobacterium] nativiensis TaxID=2855503 RepID=A0ABU5XYC0_9MYCO|nr:cytochrome P450 [Mycolicibacter sp. MYC340]MEB3032893.1 cytochrome P450 [Mycolicibacter sp. MYC340]
MTATRDTFWMSRNPVGRGRDLLRSRQRSDAAPRPPGPRGRPFVGVLPELKADPFGYLQRLGDAYGDVFRLPLPLYDVVIVNNPEHVRHVMNHRNGEYSMTGPVSWAKKLLGASMQLLEGNDFRQRRKLLGPMMGRTQLTKVAAAVADEFAVRLTDWDRFADTGETIDLQHEINGVVIPAFMRAMFSTAPTDDVLAQLDTDIRTLMASASSPLLLSPPPRLLPGDGNPIQAWWRMRRWVTQQIEERLAAGTSHDDLLQVLLDARYEDGTPISRRDAVTEAVMLIGGGYETVVAALAWTLALLPQNPLAQQRLYDEIDLLAGARPGYQDLDRLQWTKACFDEGQRLQGLLLQPRFAMTDDTIGGYRIRRGNLIGIPIYHLQRDPRWWGPNADSYDPMRFYDKQISAARPPLAYMPFGAGPHRCFGAAMGYLEAQFLLTQIFQRYRILTPAGWAPQHDAAVVWPVKGGVPAVITPRPESEHRTA